MRKMIFLAVAGFLWRKLQSKMLTRSYGTRTVRRSRY